MDTAQIWLQNSNGSLLPEIVSIRVSENVNGTKGQTIQLVTFNTGCSAYPNICHFSFGGSVLNAFQNEVQGTVECAKVTEVDSSVQLVVSFDLKNGQALEIITAIAKTNFTWPHSFVDLVPSRSVIENGHTVAQSYYIPWTFVDTTFGLEYIIRGKSAGPDNRTCYGQGTETFIMPGQEITPITCPPVPAPRANHIPNAS